MKRLNNKGFMFAETLVVTTILMVSIILIYTIFSSLYTNYLDRTKYENIEALYACNNVKTFFEQSGINYLAGAFEERESEPGDDEYIPPVYIDLSEHDSSYFPVGSDDSYYSKVINYSEIERVIFTKYDLEDLIASEETTFKRSFIDYLNFLQRTQEDGNVNTYRIIVQLNNGNFGNLIVISTL